MSVSKDYCPVSHADQLDKLVEWLEDRSYNQYNVSGKPDKYGNQLVSLTYKFADGSFVQRGLVGCLKSKDQNPQHAHQKDMRLLGAVLDMLKRHAAPAEAGKPATRLASSVVDLYPAVTTPTIRTVNTPAVTLGDACPQLKTLQHQLQKPKERPMQEDTKPKKRSKKAPPIYLRQMIKMMGSEQRVAEELGVVVSTVALGAASAEVSAIHENAAKFWVQAQEKATPANRVFAIVAADKQTMQFIATTLAQFGGTLTEVVIPT